MHDVRERILDLERATRELDPARPVREQWQSIADTSLNKFLDGLPNQSGYREGSEEWLRETLANLEQSASVEELLPLLVDGLGSRGIATAGPGHLGFVPGGGLYSGALADHIAATVNVFSADAFASPLAVALHQQSVRWLCSILGYDEDAWGDITSGGSHATITAMHTARYALNIRPRDYHRSCLYMSEHTHHCIKKAAHILFSDEVCIRQIPLKDFRMDADALAEQIRADQKAGLRPAIVIATAGSTNLGRVDPLNDLAQIAHDNGLWFHVDAACGGFFTLCGECDELFMGIEKADSVVLDPHKGMFLPYGCGAVLVRKGQLLRDSLEHSGSYLQDRGVDMERSPMDYSMELTRPFRSLRIWLALKIHGEDQIRQALREKLLLARYVRDELQKIPGIQLFGPMDLSILAFRFSLDETDHSSDAASRELLKRIRTDGTVFLSSTMIEQKFVIRVAILSFRTHLETIEALLKTIKKYCDELRQEALRGDL